VFHPRVKLSTALLLSVDQPYLRWFSSWWLATSKFCDWSLSYSSDKQVWLLLITPDGSIISISFFENDVFMCLEYHYHRNRLKRVCVYWSREWLSRVAGNRELSLLDSLSTIEVRFLVMFSYGTLYEVTLSQLANPEPGPGPQGGKQTVTSYAV